MPIIKNMKFEWFVASRYLRSRRKQSFISIISIISIGGVALGVATVILVIAVLDGVEHGLKDRFLSNEAHVVLSLIDQSFFRDYQKRIERIEALEDVVAASPAIWTQTGVFRERTETIQDVIIIKGIDPAQEDKVTGFSTYVDGSTDLLNSELIENARFIRGETITGGIILGGRLAARLGIIKGDVLRLLIRLVPNPVHESMLSPDLANFVVIGFYESEMEFYDSNLGLIHINSAQKLYDAENRANTIFVRLTDAELAPRMATRIEDVAGFTVLEGMPNAITWMERQAPLFSALRLEKIATVIIEALIILVASFNIASTLIMTVMEKNKRRWNTQDTRCLTRQHHADLHDSGKRYREPWDNTWDSFRACPLLASQFQCRETCLLVCACACCATSFTSPHSLTACVAKQGWMEVRSRYFMVDWNRVRTLLCSQTDFARRSWT